MRRLKTLLFLLSSLVIISCNQNHLGAFTAAKNLVSLPFKGISNYFSNNEYDDVESRGGGNLTFSERTIAIDQEDNPSCEADQSSTSPELPIEDYGQLMNETRNLVCSCRPFGSCDKDLCSCENLCPDNFDIFKREPYQNSLEDLSQPEHSLSFRNADAMYLSSIQGTNGYCWGHASVTSKFNRLAFFNPEDTQIKEALNAPPNSDERNQAIQYYKDVIDQVVDNKVTSIPGFRNLNEFSAHPDLQTYLADKVANSWAERAMSMQGLSTAVRARAMEQEASEQFFKEIIKKIDHNQQPQIVFTKEGERFKTHAVLVSDYKVVDDKVILCIRDNNYYPFRNAQCLHQMKIMNDGSINYTEWGILGRVELAHNDNPDAISQFHALREYCAQTKDCPIQKKDMTLPKPPPRRR